MMYRICVFTIIFYMLNPGFAKKKALPENEGGKRMQLTSSAFKQEGMIPVVYTCDSTNISPPLAWDSVPEGTKSLALICDDPDAPMGTWVHWVLFNLPADTRELPENLPPGKELSNGAKQGVTDFRKIEYGGPCPPGGTHRYFFKLYALDTMLELEAGATKTQLELAMKGHIMAEARLMGKYQR